jgi:hypothetical protein
MSLAIQLLAAMTFAPISLFIALVSVANGKPEPTPAPRPIVGLSQLYRYVDRFGSQSRVERLVGADGVDSLHAVSEIAPADGAPTRIEEWVRLDASGRLAHAEITRLGGRTSWDRLVLDVPSGTVLVSRRGQTTHWKVATDQPLVYAGVIDGRGKTVATPVSAWIAFRAALASPEVRVVFLDSRQSYLAPRDQLSVSTEIGTTVVLGNDGADVDATGFVARVRLSTLGTTLNRVSESAKLKARRKDAVL